MDALEQAKWEIETNLAPFNYQDKVVLELSKELSEQEFTLVGNGTYRICGGSETALLYGVYELLNALGFRMFSPDEWDLEKPAELEIKPLDIHWKPRLEYRGFFVVEARETPAMMRWMAWHKLNLWGAKLHQPELARQFGMKLRGNSPSGMHRSFADFLPPERYFATHPEYYGLRDGKRTADMKRGDADNFCTSNAEAMQVFTDNLTEALENGSLSEVDLLNLAPFDNGHWCECEKCRAIGNFTTRMLYVAYYVQKAIAKKVSRPVVLVVPAYHETLDVPDRPLPDDFDYSKVLIQFFPIERCYAHDIDDASCFANDNLNKNLLAWSNLGKFRLIIGEYYNVSTMVSLAVILDKGMAHDIPYYIAHSAYGIDYMHVSTALWGELAVNNCAFAAALCDEPFDFRDFCEKRYHAAASEMVEFYDILRRATANCKCLKHYQAYVYSPEQHRCMNYGLTRKLLSNSAELFLPGHFELDKDYGPAVSLETTVRLLGEASAKLQKALQGVRGDELSSARIKMDLRRLQYTLDIVCFLYTFTKLRLAERQGDEAAVKRLAAEWRIQGEALRQETTMMDHVREEGAPNLSLYKNGLTALQCEKYFNEYFHLGEGGDVAANFKEETK
ncbi:MAG: DUF4838 domain-containing protein [Victivallales bacterium]|nr:DUF4838 domain-containing protein [Victivallales bacterium]